MENECILCGTPGGYPYCNDACRAADEDEDDDPHGGCIEPHLRGDGELHDCDGRPL